MASRAPAVTAAGRKCNSTELVMPEWSRIRSPLENIAL